MTFPKAPILLITFNRPLTTRKVLDAILKSNPTRLYIFNDGPRINNIKDVDARSEIIEMVENLNCDFDIFKYFARYNLGCGPGPVEAINWAFKNEDRLIIIEDDFVPSLALFPYCNELLEKYKHDTRIWRISGSNPIEEFNLRSSFTFSHFGQSWGWATWKRCWEKFDFEMLSYPEFKEQRGFDSIFHKKQISKTIQDKIDLIYKNFELKSHIWDYQALYSIYSNNGLIIVPKKNLITNIGINGIHTTKQNNTHFQKRDESFKITSIPEFIINNREYDEFYFRKLLYKKRSIIIRIIRKIVKYFSQ